MYTLLLPYSDISRKLCSSSEYGKTPNYTLQGTKMPPFSKKTAEYTRLLSTMPKTLAIMQRNIVSMSHFSVR
jgi:hypothetical protein